jgi:prepilin peptidase CpaA
MAIAAEQSSLAARGSAPSQNGWFSIFRRTCGIVAALPAWFEARLKPLVLAGAVLLAGGAGWTDLGWRRIPNWLTVPALLIGVIGNTVLSGMSGLKTSLLGAMLGLALLLPFVLLRSLGAGDWKFAGALGAFTGPALLVDLLLASVFVAGVMAVALVIYKRRTRQTIRNIGHILISLVTFRLPGTRVSLDNPESLKVPYGVALAFTVVLYGIFWKLRLVA